MKARNKELLTLTIVYFILNLLLISAMSLLQYNGSGYRFIVFANLFLYLLSLASVALQKKGLQSSNPNVFVRSVYSSIILKMFIIMIAALIYVFIERSKINKPALFTAMGLYIVYTVVEVTILMKAAKKKNA